MYFNDPLRKGEPSVRLIDFGFLCTNIIYKDGGNLNLGYYYDISGRGLIPTCNKPYVDIILFLAHCIRDGSCRIFAAIQDITGGYNVKEQFKNIITLNNDDMMQKFQLLKGIGRGYAISTWDYAIYLDIIVKECNDMIKTRNQNINLKKHRLGITSNSFIQLIPDIDTHRIFKQVFACMNMMKQNIEAHKIGSHIDVREQISKPINYSIVKLYDLDNNDEFGDFKTMYESRKAAYLTLLADKP